MKKKPTKMIPLVAAGIVPAATVTSALLSPLALGGTGDLDPSFGDLGRLGPILNGPAWSLEPLEDGTILLAGGDQPYYYYYYSATNFVSLLSDTGSIDPSFTAASINDTQVFDVVRQPDGQVVAVGRKRGFRSLTTQLTVVRLQSSGPLDTTFGTNGIFELSVAEHGDKHGGRSVVLDPDGRIIVAGPGAGLRDDQLIVLRLLPDGSLDDSFATSGVFAGPVTFDFSSKFTGARTSLLRTAAGGYRVTVSNPAGCQIVGLTADGVIDDAFGTAGIATVDAPLGASTYCQSMVSQANGRLLLAGSADGQGFVARVRENGNPDPAFSADAVSDALAEATAVAAAADGSIVVAGRGVNGASIMRLQANGELDPLFGNAGSTFINLRSEGNASPVVYDLIVRADGSVVAAGGFLNQYDHSFVVRLLGAGGGDSPGVLGVGPQGFISTAEGTAEVVVHVRRTGGASGSVSVAYQTAAQTTFPLATAGQDYDAASGRLTWADGDRADQQVHVPILTDNVVEQFEYFHLTLSDAQGGAGLGTITATVEIAADGSPFGQFSFSESTRAVPEFGAVRVTVMRNYYDSGAVSVTLTPTSGTATAGADFTANPVTLSWADGDPDSRFVDFTIIDDELAESGEAFTVELANPTGGAVIGSPSSILVQIAGNDQPPPRPASSGGGAFGFLSLLLLGMTNFLRAIKR